LTEDVWRQRFQDIVGYEAYLHRNGIVPIKFFLHLSKEEQRRRLLARTENSDKHWKFSLGDFAERRHWDRYMEAYEDMIRNTATAQAPWHVVPADNKWFTRLIVASTVVEVLRKLDPQLPRLGQTELAALEEAQHALQSEG
jgi:polyphosphate kinase 2 (PPK2 family)